MEAPLPIMMGPRRSAVAVTTPVEACRSCALNLHHFQRPERPDSPGTSTYFKEVNPGYGLETDQAADMALQIRISRLHNEPYIPHVPTGASGFNRGGRT